MSVKSKQGEEIIGGEVQVNREHLGVKMKIFVYSFLELKGTECEPHQWSCSLISSRMEIPETREIINILLTAPFLGFSPSPWVWVEVSRPTCD